MREALRAAGLMGSHRETPQYEEEDEASSRVYRPRVKRSPEPRERRGSSFKDFMTCKPPSYKGGDDPAVCLRWIRRMEMTFDSGDFTESQKVKFAVMMFEGDALDWWVTLSQSLSAEVHRQLTWERLVEKLKTRFCGQGAHERYERDFMNLKKGSLSVSKYSSLFMEKLQFAKHMCPTETKMVNRYVEGLPYPYKATVRSKATFDEAMDEARRVEDDLKLQDLELDKGEKRKFEGSSGSAKKKTYDNKKGDRKEPANECKECHTSHQGPCNKGTVRCFKCGKTGHYANECPGKEMTCFNCNEVGHLAAQCTKPKAKAKARAFNMLTDHEG